VSQQSTMRLDQIGAMKRPPWLLDVFKRHKAGEATDQELREAQDRSIRELVAKQEAAGMPVVTDGEHRRRVFMQSFTDSVSGFAPYDYMANRTPLQSKLKKTGNRPLDERRFVKPLTSRTIKSTFLSPVRMIQAYDAESGKAFYPDAGAFAADVTGISRQIVKELADDGCQYVSVDAPFYTGYMDRIDRQAMIERGVNIEAELAQGIAADNAVIENIPGVTFGIHLCRGGANRPGRYKEGGYEPVAEQMFNTLAHQRLLLEFDSERAGGFEPLRFVPKGKVVVLGLVSTKLAHVEDADHLKRRIDEASKYLPLEQLALSAACGFGGSPDAVHMLITEDDQWRKIEVMRKVVEDVWS
jgi:5-methyltetrahydropteroyltriglutamate--homocysteine methyltransferase